MINYNRFKLSRLSAPINQQKRHSTFTHSAAFKLDDLLYRRSDLAGVRKAFRTTKYNKITTDIDYNLKLSLYFTIIRGEVVVYGLTDDYADVVRMLYNRYVEYVSDSLRKLPYDRRVTIFRLRNMIKFRERNN